MNEKNKIPLAILAERLDRALRAKVGMWGLRVLMYGWRKKFHLIDEHTLYNRRQENGEAWLTVGEARSLSRYAGYDLTQV